MSALGLGTRGPLCVLLLLFFYLSSLSLPLPPPKNVECFKLPNFGCLLAKYGRKARKVHPPSCGPYCLKEKTTTIGRGGSQLSPSLWSPSESVRAPRKERGAPLPNCVFGSLRWGAITIIEQERKKKKKERRKRRGRRRKNKNNNFKKKVERVVVERT